MIGYVINLKKDEQRWEDMKKEFKGSSIQIRRFDAIKDSVGAYGLMKSFIGILKIARKNKLKNVLILEDDCKLTPNWQSNWNKITKWLDENPEKWDIYSGSGWNVILPDIVGEIDNKIAFFDPLISWSANYIYIPQRNYSRIIKHFDSIVEYIKYPLLHYIFVLDNIINFCYKTLISYPFIAYQKDTYKSNIHQGILTKKFKTSIFVKEEKRLKQVYSSYKKRIQIVIRLVNYRII